LAPAKLLNLENALVLQGVFHFWNGTATRRLSRTDRPPMKPVQPF
jgi:hypothetical protein